MNIITLILVLSFKISPLSYSPEKVLIDSLPEGLRFRIPGCVSRREGLPDLPMREVLIGVPQKGRIRVEVYPGDYEIRRGIEVAPVPRRFPDGDKTYEEDLEVYGRDEFYPKDLVRIREIGWLRNIRVAIVEISPIQYNPRRREVRIYKSIGYRLISSSPPKSLKLPDPFDRLYKRMILNYEECKDWRGVPPPLEIKTPFSRYREWVKIRIKEQGVYKIGYKDLEKLGISPSFINPRTFKIFNIGRFTPGESYPDSMVEVPIYVYGEKDGRFDKRDYILFYGHPVSYWDYDREEFINNPYTFYNCYWLTWGGEEGKRFTRRTTPGRGKKINSSLSIFHLERDEDNPGRGGVLWIWKEFSPGGIAEESIEFSLPHAESLLYINLSFYPERLYKPFKFNKIEVSLNSKRISTLSFGEGSSPCNPIPVLKTIQVNDRVDEKNELLLKLLGRDANPIFLDYIDFIYKQRFSLKGEDLQIFIDSPGLYEFNIEDVSSSPFILEITDYSNPSVISDFELSKGVLKFKAEIESKGLFYITEEERFLKPSSLELSHPGGLLSSNFSPDYIIISPDEFYEGAQILARYRREKGMESIGIAKISQVYDDFGFGLEDPIAIKRFFSLKQPHYGLFLSDGTYDYRGITHKMDFKMVPPYEIGESINTNCAHWSGITAYEVWYADWDGNGSTPDMTLGRVCVRNKREIGNFLDKLKRYESSPGGWMRRFILLGDDVWAGKPGEADMGSTHIDNCEKVGDAISDRFDLVKVYLTEYPYKGTPAKPDATKALLREWNKGAAGLCYFGHGAGTQLTHEQVFTIGMVASLHNGNKLPVALFESCKVGRFDDEECIAEELVRSSTGGTIASMAASGAGGANPNFAITLLSSLLRETARLGDAFYSAWHLEPNSILFGDPAMEVQFPKKGGEIEIEPPYLQLGGETKVTANVDITSGHYSLSVYAPQYHRVYKWTQNDEELSMQYDLPGQEFYYGLGKVEKGTIKAEFFTPKELGPDKREVEDGTYTKIKNSALITIIAWDSKERYRLYKNSIPVKSTEPREDKEGPEITLYADNEPIMEGDTLPNRFTLKGKLSDPSGILSADINTTPKHDFLFYINTSENAVYLYDYFRYDEGSDTSGQFSYPVELPEAVDTIVVVAYDNLFNQTVKRVTVISRSIGKRLSIKNPIVYPNPIKREGYFTFHLNKPAWVRIKVYTISGRPIKIFDERRFGYGYNQVYWDGRDGDGDYPANGVYLYKISARSGEGEYYELLGKFIILK